LAHQHRQNIFFGGFFWQYCLVWIALGGEGVLLFLEMVLMMRYVYYTQMRFIVSLGLSHHNTSRNIRRHDDTTTGIINGRRRGKRCCMS
jgi:hypothetical protein